MVETAKKFKKYLFNEARVGRGNKSQLLNDELTRVENRIEHIRAASQSTYKKLAQSMQSHGHTDFDKRQSRLTENGLAKTMSDASKLFVNENEPIPAFGCYLQVCADVQADLAKEKASYEEYLDNDVISPLQNLVDREIPVIYKQRERLKRLLLDKDKAEKALEQAMQNTNSIPPAKIEALKDEADEAASRCQQSKDQFISGIFEYLSKESEHAQIIANFYSKQLEYHKKCAELLEDRQPEFHETRDKTAAQHSFGVPLSDHLRQTGREIALPLEACVTCLLYLGLKEEGIFRLAGGAGKLRMTTLLLDGGITDLPHYDLHEDIHAVAGALKQYLRELPEPLLTHELYHDWMNAASVTEYEQQLTEIWTIVNKLPDDNRNNLRYLMKFCHLVESYSEVNKMSAHNLSVVIAPNLMWSHVGDISESMMISSSIRNVVECLITYCDYFFPGEVEFVLNPTLSASYMSLLDSSPDPLYSNMETILSSTVPPAVAPVVSSPGNSHVRNSSSDLNLSDSSSAAPKKQKSRAPPPPPQTSPSKPNERNKSSSNDKPPIAAKRSSTKKPQGPPPKPPSDSTEEVVPKPRSTPRSAGSGEKPPIAEKPVRHSAKDADVKPLTPDDTPPPPEDWLASSESRRSPQTGVDTDGNVFTAL